jgi:nicotinamide-nucleotide amidase
MRAEIVSIGTELLLGSITDTNAAYLAQRLAALGIDCYYVSQVGDNLDRIVGTLKRGWERSDLIITTGGLGPTGDDLTREAISELLGERMQVDSVLETELLSFFARRAAPMPETNLKQAALIPSSEPLLNPVGTAPGWWVSNRGENGDRFIVAMPGVPYEMRRMWEREVEPRLRAMSSTVIRSRTLKVLGMGESAVEEKVRDLMAGSNPTLAPYAKQDGVHLRITAKAHDAQSAEPLIAALEEAVRVRLGEAVYGADDETPGEVVRRLLVESGYTSCLLEVGGGVAGALGSIVGSDAASSPVVALYCVPGLRSLGRAIPLEHEPGAGGELDLETAARAVQRTTETDVALAVMAHTTPADVEGSAVVADVEICLVAPDDAGQPHVAHVRQTWRTDPFEVRRLSGLAAVNLLRLRLLKNRKLGSQR